MDKFVSPEKLFEDVAAFISESRAQLQKGVLLEMKNLDGEVKSLCEAILQLTPEQGKQYESKLQELFSSLTELGNELQQQRDAVAEEIRGLASHRKAHVAYSAADATDAFGKKKDKDGNS